MDDYIEDPSDDALFEEKNDNAGGLGRERLELNSGSVPNRKPEPVKKAKIQLEIKDTSKSSKPELLPDLGSTQEMLETIRALTNENAVLTGKLKEALADREPMPAEKGSLKKVIVDLNTQIRQLTSANERYKSKIADLEQVNRVLRSNSEQLSERLDILSRRQQNKMGSEGTAVSQSAHPKSPREKEPDESALLKIGQMTIQINTLTKENTTLKTLLQKETGKDLSKVSLNTLAASYRGRAEEIVLLKEKIANLQTHTQDLEAEVARLREPLNVPNNPETEYLGEQATTANYIANLREQYNSQLESLTADNQRKAQRITEQEARIKELVEKEKKSTVRIASLNNELGVVKKGAKSMIAKAKHDDLTIALLRKYVDTNPTKSREGSMYDELLAAENAVKAIEAKLGAVMQAANASPDQAIYIAAAARLETHELRAVVEDLQLKVDLLSKQVRELECARMEISAFGTRGTMSGSQVSSSGTNANRAGLASTQESDIGPLSANAYESQIAAKDFELTALRRVVEQLDQAFASIGGAGAIFGQQDFATRPANSSVATDLTADTSSVVAANQAVAQQLINTKPKRTKRTKEFGEEAIVSSQATYEDVLFDAPSHMCDSSLTNSTSSAAP